MQTGTSSAHPAGGGGPPAAATQEEDFPGPWVYRRAELRRSRVQQAPAPTISPGSAANPQKVVSTHMPPEGGEVGSAEPWAWASRTRGTGLSQDSSLGPFRTRRPLFPALDNRSTPIVTGDTVQTGST